MKKTNILLTFILMLAVSLSSHAQYCAAGPTSGADSNVENISLTGDAGTSFDYTPPCPGVTGVDDQRASSVTVTAGTMYTGSITWGSCGGNYGNSGTIWIDYNQNFAFEPSEVVHTFDGTPTVTETFSFTLPVADAVNGTQVMRVMQRETSIAPPLDPCASYSWGSVIDFSIEITGGNGTPAPIPYCASGPTSSADSNVGNVAVTGDNTSFDYTPTCPGTMGLDDQTALVADVTPGQSYSGSITWGTCGGNYGNSGTIWIDWNQNSTFDPAEVVHTFDGTPIVTEAINFTVPMDATPGATTMRVKQQETSSTPPLDPCGSFLWGGVVDFSISVTDPCPPAENISIDNISDVSANVNFDANGENVNVEITAAGAGQGNGTMTNDVTSPYTFTGLTASTDYDVYVQRACANGFQSAWDGPHSFSTFSTCGTPNANISNISDVSADINFTTPNGEPVNIEVTAAGAGQGNNVIISMNGLTSGPFTFNGLAESTSYDVYIQTDCGTNLSSVVGPISFTTLKTPVISLTDSSGDGFPNISDPCDCNDSDNIVDAGTNVVTWFHDYVTINSNPGETWTITNYTGGQMYSAPGVAIPTGTALTEVFPGFYRIDFLHENGTGFEAQFNRSVNPLAAPMMIGNSCDGVFCSMEAVPTMGEWSMIIFALIMLSFGVVYVMRQQVALAGFETANTSAFNQRVPFEKGIFRTILAYVMIGLAVTFAVAVTMFGYEMTNADIPGSLIAGPMLAYFIHLLVMSSKEKEA